MLTVGADSDRDHLRSGRSGRMGIVTTATTGVLRVLGPQDLPELRALLARDLVTHCFVAGRVHAAGMDSWRLGGEVWGWAEGGRLVSAAYLGANLVPVELTPTASRAVADRARRIGRRCSSIVGTAADVQALWSNLAEWWGPARQIRRHQPLLEIRQEPLIPADPLVQQVSLDELEMLLPACVAMFTEEVGVSPLAGGAANAYRSRVAEVVRSGRAFARIEEGRVVFKAEIGSWAPGVCQVQGVWVDPHHRGKGLAAPAMSAVVRHAYGLAPIVSLYVNDFNTPARAAYCRVGFQEVGEFTSILF